MPGGAAPPHPRTGCGGGGGNPMRGQRKGPQPPRARGGNPGGRHLQFNPSQNGFHENVSSKPDVAHNDWSPTRKLLWVHWIKSSCASDRRRAALPHPLLSHQTSPRKKGRAEHQHPPLQGGRQLPTISPRGPGSEATTRLQDGPPRPTPPRVRLIVHNFRCETASKHEGMERESYQTLNHTKTDTFK